jgi:hypothetical protein
VVFQDQFIGEGGQARIGVQEDQNIALRFSRAGVHLRGPTARRDDDAVANVGREARGVVIAAAVDDDYLVAAAAQRRQRLEGGADARRLVQRRDDDRKSFSDQS